MKLLFDENLAPSLVGALADVYPQSTHVRNIELKSAADSVVWKFAANQQRLLREIAKKAASREVSAVQ